ncbi:conserved unknown protein [Ectocarpus siliculosus]|uniref:Uncharacterized protein n=1 Tax=Ectocarpus siliculosus TaxID=2880 RepID=D7FZH5_ECTSI|nr:conserved unknown protein [Ectocarpus siliculosus]|eukprot:CBJ49285.1 conserved unknown protein [Ectocarpus siliculosus]
MSRPFSPATGRRLCRSGVAVRASRTALPKALQTRGGTIISSSSSSVVAEDNRRSARRRFSVVWGRYLNALNDQPLLTKALSSGVVSGTANIIEQTLSAAKFDWGGWVVFSLTGIVFKGMFLHYWYNILDRALACCTRWPSLPLLLRGVKSHGQVEGNAKGVTSRVPGKWGRVSFQGMVDTIIGATLLNCGYFAVHEIFSAITTGRLFPLPELGLRIVKKIASRYSVMMVANCRVWPPVVFLNFAFVPPDLRVLVSNFVAVFWGYLLSKWCR